MIFSGWYSAHVASPLFAAWPVSVLDLARRREPVGSVSKKLEIIRAAAQHDYPVSEIGDMLAEIERGYGTGAHP